jgi:hypothetical protein
MNEIQLIQGTFNSTDALNLITEMIQVKIKFHESKITDNSNEEDIKYRETKIKTLQNILSDLRNQVNLNEDILRLEAKIQINP